MRREENRRREQRKEEENRRLEIGNEKQGKVGTHRKKLIVIQNNADASREEV